MLHTIIIHKFQYAQYIHIMKQVKSNEDSLAKEESGISSEEESSSGLEGISNQRLQPHTSSLQSSEPLYQMMDAAISENISKMKMELATGLNNIKYDSALFHSQVEICVEEFTTNFEIIKITVAYGYFSALIKVINVDHHNPVCELTDVFAGSFGNVYKALTDGIPVAIKTIKFTQDKFQNIFKEAAKEYFFLCIASALGVGPKVVKELEFDIVIFKDSLVFSMQFCEMSSCRMCESADLLNRKLNLMHMFHMVHMDIKPENIGFSPTLSQFIFIDFGLSRMVREEIGEKTLINFSGSFNYCSPEMLGVYVKDSVGLVDLYFNDQHCLRKSISAATAFPEEPEELFWKAKLNLQKFSDCQLLLRIKHAIYDFAFTARINYALIRKHPAFIASKYQHLISFIATLPQSLLLITFCKKELNALSKTEQLEYFEAEERIRGQGSQQESSLAAFNKRCALMQITASSISLKFEEATLFEEQGIRRCRPAAYRLALVKFIKINGSADSHDKKLKACKVYWQLCGKSTEDSSEMYRKTISSIFTSAVGSSEPEAFQTLKNAIPTVAILEAVTQDQYIQGFQAISVMKLSLIQRLRLLFKFIASLEFVREKFRTDYDYDQLTLIFFQTLNSVINFHRQSGEKTFNQILSKLKVITNWKIGGECLTGSQWEMVGGRSVNEEHQAVLLGDQISYYLLTNQIVQYAEEFNEYNKTHCATLLEWLCSTNRRQCFTYSHLALFAGMYSTSQAAHMPAIYQVFWRELRHHPHYAHFKIYFLHRLNTIRHAYSKKLLADRCEASVAKLDQGSLCYEEIFGMLEYIVRHVKKFHSYLGYLLAIPALQASPTCMRHLCLFVRRNPAILTFSPARCPSSPSARCSHCSASPSLLSPHNQLRNEIQIANNMLLLSREASTEGWEWVGRLEALMRSAREMVRQCACFECKVSSLLEINHIYANYLCNRDLVEESLLHVADMVVLGVRAGDASGTLSFLTHLIRRWAKHEWLYAKYDLRPFIYEYVTSFERHYVCLMDVREYNIFLHLYLFIVEHHSPHDLQQFVVSVLLALQFHRSAYFINNFYYSILFITRQLIHSNQLASFKAFHDPLVRALLRDPLFTQNPYKALYLAPLLEAKVRGGAEVQMLWGIASCIDLLDKYSKQILLGNYYRQSGEWMPTCGRKQGYLRRHHIKQSPAPAPLRLLLKSVLPRVRARDTLQTGSLRRAIETYYSNIGSVRER